MQPVTYSGMCVCSQASTMCTTTMNFIVVVHSMKVIMYTFTTSGADSDFQLECIKIKLRGEGGGLPKLSGVV